MAWNSLVDHQHRRRTSRRSSQKKGGSSCTQPRSSVAPSKVVAAFANDRAKMHTAARAHPDPTALCIGFSGRSSKKSDPTVAGQVADMSMRSVFCPIVVCKHAPVNAKKRHFVYIADATDRCIDGMKILDGFLQKDDRLTFLHALTHGSEEAWWCFREYEKRSNFEFIADDWRRALDVLREPESLADVDYVLRRDAAQEGARLLRTVPAPPRGQHHHHQVS